MLATAALQGSPAPSPASDIAPGVWSLGKAPVEAWFASARPGDEIVYARGAIGPKGEGVDLLRRLFDEGAVTFKQRKLKEFDNAYIARRREHGDRPREAMRLAQPPRLSGDEDETAMLMAALRRRAGAKRHCGTNRELGVEISELLGSPDALGPDRVAYLLRKQVSAGKLRIDASAAGGRIVTIVASGQRTAPGGIGR